MKYYRVKVDGNVYEVQVEQIQPEGGDSQIVPPKPSPQHQDRGLEKKSAPSSQQAPSTGEKGITAPMAGTVLSVQVKAGQDVQEGDLLLILEAMKMENEISAPFKGKVKAVLINPQQTVESGQLLIEME